MLTSMEKMNAHRLYKSKIEDGEYPDIFHKLDINDYEIRINYRTEKIQYMVKEDKV